MFECQKCGQLGLNPYCETCPRSQAPPIADPSEVLELDDELIVAEEVIEEPLTLDDDFLDFDSDLELDFDELEIDLGEQEGEKTILSLSDVLEKTEFENLDSDLADAEFDEELKEELDDWDDDE
jgi:hypothetical protein